MDIREIEQSRQQANDLFRQKKMGEALKMYESSLLKASGCASVSNGDTALSEQMSLLAYNISTVHYKRGNFRKSLSFALESLKYLENDKAMQRICALYLRLGMAKEFKSMYDKIGSNKKNMSEIEYLVSRMKLNYKTIGVESGLAWDDLHEMCSKIANGDIIAAPVIERILSQGESILLGRENVVYIDSQYEVLIFGDTHGQYFDVLNVFNQVYNQENVFIFNGDYVDRGSHSVENFIFLLSLSILLPNRFLMTRGNHELLQINRKYGFYEEMNRKYTFNGDFLYQKFQNVFQALPIAVVVNDKVFVVHGGLPEEPVILEKVQEMYRMTNSYTDVVLRGLLWSDPDEIEGTKESERGAGIIFGKSITERFFEDNGIELLVRSHQAVDDGYKMHHDGHVVTIFSAPDYEGTEGSGAYIVVNPSRYGENERVKVQGSVRYAVRKIDKSVGNEVLQVSFESE
ncbi:calcineurin-like phosphoesterase [Ordospora colligata]|uniref:Calcineurin-like phosphoesterase n=1 Tax=Ordospora colligata OC4 TaxID=1354746 RepID=A0A0B2UHJ4_9MICR|nr:calcineurin-like phosphoesterase [Ordospora colligata OC4]KHN70556.1 calcineurin-like phosphoesterase [Ordospora colligata OC4]TBU17306.1 calcineurin-like phosphoesterase [Ordospora colligata]TBU17556.1 calcineurin-like phosphoesterase [Ordospora colligata]TBU19736.1 calcineurin-like phosphoesterase [Ordospora colligata]